MTLDQLNHLEPGLARATFLNCCGSLAWAHIMTDRRPYRDLVSMQKTAQEAWLSLSERDWLEAFAAHPKIGEKASAGWSAAEQSGMTRASEETASAISRLNEEYKHKFGWIFIVCATGKSAEEMLQLLTIRLRNESQAELPIVAAEQLKITHLRLGKLVAE